MVPPSFLRRRIALPVLCACGAVIAIMAIVVFGDGGAPSPGAHVQLDQRLDRNRPDVRRAQTRAAAQRARHASPAAKSERQRSRKRYRDLGGVQALRVGRSEQRAVLRDRPPRPLAGAYKQGMVVAHYASDYAAVLRPRNATAASKNGVMAMSTLPLRSRDTHGRLRSVNMSLEQAGDRFVSDNAPVKVSIGERVGDGFRVSARQIGIVPLDVAALTPGVISGGAVFFANSTKDADHIVRVTPAGAESLVQLRSIDSPQRFRYRLDLPADGALQLRKDGSISVSRDGHRVGTIATPIAWDADQQPIPVTTTLRGNVLELDVAHRGRDIRYPAIVDPAYTDLLQYRWDANDNVNSKTYQQWAYTTNVGTQLAGSFNSTSVGGAANGLYSISRGAQTLLGGSYGYWRFYAPGTTSVAQVEWTHMSHSAAFAGGPAPCIGYGILLDTMDWLVRQGECGNFASGYRRTCWDCNDTDGFSYASNIKAAQFGTEVYTTTAANLSDTLGQVTAYLVDIDDPTVTLTSQPSSAWTNNPTGTISANATDPGLGVESIDITGAGTTYNSGCLYAGPCPNSMSRSASVTSLNLPDGNNTVAVTARDASYFSHRDAAGNIVPGKHQSSATAAVKLDRQPPEIALSGTLNDARNGFIGPNQDYTLNVTATDGSLSSPAAQRSGATSLTATLDGQPMTNGSAAAACTGPEGSCSLTVNATLTAAQIADLDETVPHTIEITSSDALGHTSAPDAFTFRVDAIAPTISSEGDLLKVSGSPLTEDLYHVNVEARDNTPTIPEVEDDGTEIVPDDLPGAGMKDLVVRVDGESVATTPIACFNDPACEQARRWTWDTTQVSNGVHTITITAADVVDNQEGESFQVDVQRQPDEPPSTNTTVRRTILGATTSDRTGNSVAAVGDVNGDGYSDYLIGAPDVGTPGLSSVGAAYILLGQVDQSAVDLATTSASVRRIVGPGQGWYCGTSVAAAGDVNGDGLGDLLVGCPGVDSRIGSPLSSGRVYVIFGRTDPQDINLANLGTAGFVVNGPTDTLSLALPALTSHPAVFGERLQSASPDQMSKDVNGDGYDDIVIGDSVVGRGLDTGVGAAYVIYGKTDTATVAVTALGNQGFTIRGNIPSSLTGYSAAITDDVTGDTISDILIGAPGATAGTGGRAYVVSGSAADADVDLASPGNRTVTLTTGQTGDRFGVNVATLGDTDLDTYADVAVGTAEGAYVLRKVPSVDRTISADDGFRIAGPANVPGLLLATTVPEAPIAPTGDLDGDERADLIVGYPDASGSRAYTVRSPDASRTINVNALPGQRGAAITTGTQADRAGAAVAGNTYIGDEPDISENAQSIVGAPSAARAYVIGERVPVGPGVTADPDPEDAGPLSGSAIARSTATEGAIRDTPNGQVPGVYRVKASEETEWVTVRNDAQSFVIGSAHDFDNLYADSRKFGPGDGDSVDGRIRYYLHGLFGHGVHRCGWIIQKQTVFNFSPNPFPGRSCRGRPRRLPPYRFAKLMNSDGRGDGTLVRLRWIRSQATATEAELRDDLPSEIPLYRNVRPGTDEVALNPDETLPTTTIEDGVRVRTPIRWRYITKSGKFVLVRVSKTEFPQVGQNGWVFISRAWLPKAFGANRLCDDGTGTRAKEPKKPDWAPVCSHKASGYVVADHE